MNLALLRFLPAVLALAAGAGFARSAPHSAGASRPASREYVRLADWAKANDFEVRWLKRDETLQLSDGLSKIRLTVDSSEAQINGVQVWLLFPVSLRGGAACLARLDLETTLQPIVSPPKDRPGVKVKSICLDPGHGGKDPGYRAGANQEKKYTLLLAQEVRDQLKRAGWKVALTRSWDSFVELADRPDLAKSRNADLFVSLHFNSSESAQESVQGTEVYCLTPVGASSTNARGEGAGAGWCEGNRHNARNMFLAYQIQKTLTQQLGGEDRGVRRARFAVLRDAVMPAVLVEAGFMSHPVEGRKILTAAYRRQLARAIVEGLQTYKRATEREG